MIDIDIYLTSKTFILQCDAHQAHISFTPNSSSHDHFVPAMPCHQLVAQWSNGMSGICTQYPRLPPKVYLIEILLNEA